jgi:hypothetical protein
MIAEVRSSRPKRRLAYISMAISAAEVFIMGGAIVLVQILQHACRRWNGWRTELG